MMAHWAGVQIEIHNFSIERQQGGKLTLDPGKKKKKKKFLFCIGTFLSGNHSGSLIDCEGPSWTGRLNNEIYIIKYIYYIIIKNYSRANFPKSQ